MTSEQLPRHLDVFFPIEAKDYDGKVSTDPKRPETRLRQVVQRQDVRPRSQRWIGVQNATGEPLKKMRLVGIDVQMSHLDLGAGPGHPRFTFEDIRVAILFSQRDGMVARLGYAGREYNLRGF